MGNSTNETSQKKLNIALLSLHGLIRANEPELGRDADTGGQIKYVLEAAAELAKLPQVGQVNLFTRQVFDDKVGPDYAQVEEPIAENARIVRIPFGPNRYLRKEALWPYIEMFIDQTLHWFKRNGLPDLIHGHYADAGLAGAQLARLLHIPYAFTGHSLGRVKRQRLIADKKTAETIDKKYNFDLRIEAEEVALETAAMVVTSTSQEVELQYELYQHYVPERMEVIPPGVDLSSFFPPKAGDDLSQTNIVQDVSRFLQDPDKPTILTMARPDERKNLRMLVDVYGQSEELQELANLVLIMGSRDDLGDLPRAQRRIIEEVIYLIDRYDLYGKVAYPKTHQPSDVPELYRWATQGKGVFVNPALTEPFGLTLLEAAGSGLPIVATNDGGPRDIIGNCQNGLLVDPLDRELIEKAILRPLTEPDQWETWSTNGAEGAHEHYSWKKHAERYVRNVTDILARSETPAIASRSKTRRLPEFDRLIITDLDNTLTGDAAALGEFIELLKENDHIGFGVSTGRRLDSAMKLLAELGLPKPDFMDTDVGTQLHYGESLTPDRSWQKQIDHHWNPNGIRAALDKQPGFFPQPESKQSQYKVSYEIDPKKSIGSKVVKRILREAGLRAKVVISLDMYLDIIPVRGGSDLTMRHLLWKWGFSPNRVLVAGDSGNDAGMLTGGTLGVVVGNHGKELNRLKKWPRIYFAEGSHARGIIEGINYYQFLDNIVIPNDREE
ncbi:MAG: glycosyltransferase [bacterium]|nr:glycosyltransferase [bacterium]